MVEVLIASLIISSGILAGFFLIRSGLLNLSKQTDTTYITSNLPYIINYIESSDNIPAEENILGMKVRFKQHTVKIYTPKIMAEEGMYINLPFDFMLIKINFDIEYKQAKRSYEYFKIRKVQTGEVDEQ